MANGSTKLPSNSFGLWVGIAFALITIAIAAKLDDGTQNILWRSGLLGFAFIPLTISIAELRSGFAWKNLAPGNLGVAKSEKPAAYWISVVMHGLAGTCLTLLALLLPVPVPS